MVLGGIACLLLALSFDAHNTGKFSGSQPTKVKKFIFRGNTFLPAVRSIESTPNPSSFKVNLDTTLISGAGRTYVNEDDGDCPEAIRDILRIDGIESVYAMPEWVCLNKLSSSTYKWDSILPKCVAALGGATVEGDAVASLSSLMRSEQLLTDGPLTDNEQLCVIIRLQSSNGIPIQVEASEGLSTKRQTLSARFATTMNDFIIKEEEKGGSKMKFFEGRSWILQGPLYANTLEDALAAAVQDIEALYTDEDLQLLGEGSPQEVLPLTTVVDAADLNSPVDRTALRAVEQLCSLSDGLRTKAEATEVEKSSLVMIAQFVMRGVGSVAARRMAIAYLGSCSNAASASFSPFKDVIFNSLSRAFSLEKAPGLRRTAGDALSDFGDARAVPLAAVQLLEDPSKLVRWRSARILGEFGGVHTTSGPGAAVSAMGGTTAIAALEAAAVVEQQSFEVVFECMNSLAILRDGGTADSTPVWMKMTKRSND
jgi:hypothetical protein